MPHVAGRAAKVITGLACTKKEISQGLNLSPDRISVIPYGVSEDFQPAGNDIKDATLRSFDIDRPYMLAVGTIEPRKNIEILVQAYRQLCMRMPDAPLLIFCGAELENFEPVDKSATAHLRLYILVQTCLCQPASMRAMGCCSWKQWHAARRCF